jgi:chemotaxis signal transduction protein/nucleoid-associated protein YgaU
VREELAAESANTGSWLVFRVGPHVLGAPARAVEGIIQRPQRINRLPLMPEHALGAFMFREEWPLAISLGRKLGVQDRAGRAESVFIVVRVRAGLIAFGVDEVKEVMHGSEVAWKPMPEMPAAGLFDRYAIRNGEIVLHTDFDKLLEYKTGMHAVAQWAATQLPAAAVDTPAPEEPKSVAAPVATTVKEPQLVTPPPPAARSPERVRKTLRRVETTRQPAPAKPVAPRLHPRPELKLVPAHAVQPEAPAPDNVPPPAVETVTRKGASSSTYWFSGAALAAAVLIGAWFAHAPAPAPADAPAPGSAATGSIRQEQPVAAPAPFAPPPAPAIPTIESEAATLRVERPAKAESAARVHVVARGDTLSAIARKHLGDGLRYPELAQLSRIENPHRIYPGDVVRIEFRESR